MVLGIVYKNGEIINHRSILKVCFNPILRTFGLQIVSVFNGEKMVKLSLKRCPRIFRGWERYDVTGCVVERKRRVW